MPRSFHSITGMVVAVLIFTPILTGSPQAESPRRVASLKDCTSKGLGPGMLKQIEDKLRLEFRKVSSKIEDVTVLDIRCARTRDGIPLGAVILGYGKVADIRRAYDEFQKTHDIYGLLDNEQFGVFQYDASLSKYISTIKVIRSERWLDYSVSIELTSTNNLILRSAGATYGDLAHQEQLKITW